LTIQNVRKDEIVLMARSRGPVGQAGYRLMHKQCAVYPRWGCNPNE